jgi:hypothetical protein
MRGQMREIRQRKCAISKVRLNYVLRSFMDVCWMLRRNSTVLVTFVRNAKTPRPQKLTVPSF